MKELLVLTGFLLFLNFSESFGGKVVETPLGLVEGYVKESRNGCRFYSFEGVPYALPPVGERRFEEPLPVEPWEGVWQAKTTYTCMQYNLLWKIKDGYVEGDEDCLYLNIYTPDLNPEANLSVIVQIHGGAFMVLSGALLGPEYLLDKDVVYVNFNYRLGVLGFLSTESELVPGNNGIKDQVLALKWVHDNIRHFGGNPDSVTITGLSAGGASVHLHYLIPASKGLFHRGISQSGVALLPWVLGENPLEKTKKLAASLGCRNKEMKRSIECLKKRPGPQVTRAVEELQPWHSIPFTPFGVVVDTWASKPLLPDHPYSLIKTERFHDLPWLVSHVDGEGLFPSERFYNDGDLKEIDTRWNELLPLILDYNYTVDPALQDDVSQKIRQFYLPNKHLSKETFLDFVNLTTDRLFVVDIKKAARLQAAASRSSVHSYVFTYRGASSRANDVLGEKLDFGAAHADDTLYAFKSGVNKTSTSADAAMVDLMVKLLVTFANGDLEAVHEWPPVSKNISEPYIYLKIESPSSLKVEHEDRSEVEDFWSGLPIKENEKLLVVEDKVVMKTLNKGEL